MTSLAIKILFGDRAKLLGLVFGVAFATTLIAQQGGLFIGLMKRVQNPIIDASGIDIWVMDPATDQFNISRAMSYSKLHRVRGVTGVLEASPLSKSNLVIRSEMGTTASAMLLGVDSLTFAGTTHKFIQGDQNLLKHPDAIAIDRVGYMRLWPDEPIKIGKILELNDRRAKVVAITDASAAFSAQVILYTRYNQSRNYVPHGRKHLSFILVRTAPNRDPAVVASSIERLTGLKALQTQEFADQTVSYYIENTGISINFATTISLGILVGMAIVGLTFTLFIVENLKQYAVLKALGVGNIRLAGLVLSQVFIVAFIGFSIGIGLAASFFEMVASPTSALRGFSLPWWIPAGTFVFIFISVIGSTIVGLSRVLNIEPAAVFRE